MHGVLIKGDVIISGVSLWRGVHCIIAFVMVFLLFMCSYSRDMMAILWPRFRRILELNIASVRDTNPSRLGNIDTRPHYVRIGYSLSLSLPLSSLSSLSFSLYPSLPQSHRHVKFYYYIAYSRSLVAMLSSPLPWWALIRVTLTTRWTSVSPPSKERSRTLFWEWPQSSLREESNSSFSSTTTIWCYLCSRLVFESFWKSMIYCKTMLVL